MSQPVAIITGATGGMGRASAKLFAEDHHLIRADISEQEKTHMGSASSECNFRLKSTPHNGEREMRELFRCPLALSILPWVVWNRKSLP